MVKRKTNRISQSFDTTDQKVLLKKSAPLHFISYCRKDAAFAERLAEHLRSLSINIWLDKNIKAGATWDSEIQKALKISHTLICILTPDSVESDNVKDECHYYLDKHKRIIPVLLKECEVPYRIGRKQHINFTSGYFFENAKELYIAIRDEEFEFRS